MLADEGAEPGGQQLIEADGQGLGALVADVREAGVEILHQGSALGYFDGLVPVWQRDTLHQVRAARHVFATGAIEQPLVFAGNDLPGVMLSGGARRLAALYGVSPGKRAVVATTSDRGLDAAAALRAVGVQIVAVADLRPEAGALAAALRADGIPVFSAHTVIEARGSKAVTEAIIAPLTGGSRALVRVRPGRRLRRHHPRHLAAAAGRRQERATTPSAATSRCRELPDGVFAAGEVAGADTDDGGRGLRGAGRAGGRPRDRAGRRRLGQRVTELAQAAGRAGRARRRRRPAGERRGPRQVLCLHLRGRHQQGRPPLHRGGL